MIQGTRHHGFPFSAAGVKQELSGDALKGFEVSCAEVAFVTAECCHGEPKAQACDRCSEVVGDSGQHRGAFLSIGR